MLELTEETTANAVERAYEENPRVSLVTPEQDAELEGARRLPSGRKFLVTCANPEHPGGHVTRFRRHPADGSLWGECVLAATGDRCPAAFSERVCYHLASGAALFLALEDRDGLVEHAVKIDGPMPRFECRRAPRRPDPEGDPEAVLVAPARAKKVERVGGFQI